MNQHIDDAPIVVGVDHSDSAREAAEWAADIAAVWRAPLDLVHTASVPAGCPRPRWLAELVVTAQRAGANRCSAHVVQGDVTEALVDRAARARLLVLGSYGSGARAGMLAGSVALALIDRAPCPVAVVRGAAPGVPPPRGGLVVVGVDGWAAGHDALAFGAELAGAAGVRLCAVHAWTEPVAARAVAVRYRGDRSGVLEGSGALLDAELRWIRGRHPDLGVERDLVADTSVRALLRRAEGARAVVVGHRRDAANSASTAGSTARALAAFAPCPVVVLGPATASCRRVPARAGRRPAADSVGRRRSV